MKQHHPYFLELVSQVQKNVREVAVHTIKSLEPQDNHTLIDVREHNEWQHGHIPQAKHLSRGILERDIANLCHDLHQKIYIYCSGGYRSVLACESLQRMGYKQVYSLKGGFSEWVESGYPIAHETNE